MNSEQEHIATAPEANVWVSAHAGAGKTRLLTRRVLRLLVEGAAPSSILCLTYTNAAAAEMRKRITDEVGDWAVGSQAEVSAALADLLGRVPNTKIMQRARALFALLIDHEDSPRIETLHAFCQSTLRRFPLEAGLFPHFQLMDETQAHQLMREAINRSLAASRGDSVVASAVGALATVYADATLYKIGTDILAKAQKWGVYLQQSGGVEAAVTNLYRRCNFTPETTQQALFEAHFSYRLEETVALKEIASALALSKAKTDAATCVALAAWLESPSYQAYSGYSSVYLTQKGKIKERLATKHALTTEQHEFLRLEAQRVLAFAEACATIQRLRMNACLIVYAKQLLGHYSALKDEHGLLDFDELIARTESLLYSPSMLPWVLYRLDAQIDHILLDEAQDTSPAQWSIIESLTDEFFAGETAHTRPRSLFVVGDFKQSIYSFQGADVALFLAMKSHMKAKIEASKKPFYTLALNTSFRSTAPVLQAVDALWKWDDAEQVHGLSRKGHAGRVEVWPFIGSDQETEESSQERMVSMVADTVQGWLNQQRVLASKNRPIRPSDVLILMRNRGTLANMLASELKHRGIMVSGTDRMLLREHIAVEDMLALLQFLILPQDDYALACVLKSPLFNFSEEQLFELAHGREQRLVDRLKELYPHHAEQLFGWLAMVDGVSVYQLLCSILTAQVRFAFIKRLGADVSEVFDRLLQAALDFEAENPPSIQAFLAHMAHVAVVFDRASANKDALRIMTVHGAKGLQAPIVFVVDAANTPRKRDKVMWTDAGPMMSPDDDSMSAYKDEALLEYMRLLYVAMTRAEDELYVVGHSAHKQKLAPEHSWFHLVWHALSPIASPLQTPAGAGLLLACEHTVDSKPSQVIAELEVQKPLPVFGRLDNDAIQAVVTPSLDENSTPSAEEGDAVLYGKIVHYLLQIMPPEGFSKADATQWLAQSFGSKAAHLFEQAIASVQNLQASQALGWLWAEGRREVALAGMVDVGGIKRAVHGQVDIMAWRGDECWVVDYKTTQHPPTDKANVPIAYLRQMALYAKVLKAAYPQADIRTFLLWTATATLMEV